MSQTGRDAPCAPMPFRDDRAVWRPFHAFGTAQWAVGLTQWAVGTAQWAVGLFPFMFCICKSA